MFVAKKEEWTLPGLLIGLPTIVGGLALVVAALSILHGFILSTMWGWFIAPLGVPDIGIGEAIGFALVAGLLHPYVDHHDKEKAAAMLIIRPLVGLGVGALLHYVFGVGA